MNYLLVTIPVGILETNCYIFADTASRAAYIIDPGDDASAIMDAITQHHLNPIAIINTHGHWDHIGANRAIKHAYNIPLYIHEQDAIFLTTPQMSGSSRFGGGLPSPLPDRILHEGDVLPLGDCPLTVIHTPGHTPGGICLQSQDVLFTGDTLFCGCIGRCDLPGSSEEQMNASLEKIRRLPPSLKVLPGHGPASVLATELRDNPYLR